MRKYRTLVNYIEHLINMGEMANNQCVGSQYVLTNPNK